MVEKISYVFFLYTYSKTHQLKRGLKFQKRKQPPNYNERGKVLSLVLKICFYYSSILNQPCTNKKGIKVPSGNTISNIQGCRTQIPIKK